MSTRTSNKALVAIAFLGFSVCFQTASAQSGSSTGSSSSALQTQRSDPSPYGEPMTREEILKTFQREANAAYAEARQACAMINDSKEREICLARAKLQFDHDMRYAEKRANMGY